jgi:nucleoside-diphosphate-sugar epimerase
MKIIITGSNGFVGKNLLREIKDKFPGSQIICLVRTKSNIPETDNVKLCYVDYLDLNSLLNSDVFDGADYIFHVAGVTKALSEKGFRDGNVIPAINILETIKQKGIKLKRFVLISSQSASGPSKSLNHYKEESEEENPVEFYSKSKLEAEKVVKQYNGIIPYTIISPVSVYGPQDVDFFNIFKMTKMGVNVYPGNKNKYISIIFVTDLVKAIIDAALSENTINKKYFICNDEPIPWKQVHSTVFKIAGKNKLDISLPFHFLYFISFFASIYSKITKKATLLNPNKIKLSEPEFWIASNKNAKKDFCFDPKYSLEEGLKATYKWYKENGWL